MKGLKIKKEFLETTISFNGSGLPLKFRRDLHILAKIGLNTKDDLILRVFEEIPTLEQIKEYEGELFLNEAKVVQGATEIPPVDPKDEKSEPKDEKDKSKNTSKSDK